MELLYSIRNRVKWKLEVLFSILFFVVLGGGVEGSWSCCLAECRGEKLEILGRRCGKVCFSMHYIALGVLIHQSILPIRSGGA